MKTLEQLGVSPTPWELMDDGVTVVCPIDRDDDAWGEVCDCNGGESDGANARLIAAAPELYDALRRVVSRLDGSGWSLRCPEVYEAAISALAKASGESEVAK